MTRKVFFLSRAASCVCFALGSRILFLEFRFRGSLLGSSVLFFVRAVATGKMFCLAREVIFYVDFLAPAIICLAFAAFGFSGGRGIFLLGLWEFLVWLSPFFCLSGKRGEILLSSRHQPVNFFISRRASAFICS